MNNLHYFITLSKYNFKNAYVLGHSFWIGIISMIVNNMTFFIIWLLFMQATGPINGWTSLDVFGMLGVSLIAYGVTHSFFYGIHELPQFVVRGTFDNVLLSPANAFLKLGGSSFSVTAYGDLIQGIIVSIIYGALSHFTLAAWLMYIAAVILGCIVFLCIKLLTSLVVFYIHDGEVISSQLFEIFLRPGLYPGSIFPGMFKIFFMTVIPTLLTSAVAVDVVKLNSLYLLFFALIVTLVWVSITYVVFNIAIRRYESGNFLR